MEYKCKAKAKYIGKTIPEIINTGEIVTILAGQGALMFLVRRENVVGITRDVFVNKDDLEEVE